MLKGVDTAARLSAEQAKILVANGITFAGRYLVDKSMSKAITDREAKALLDSGLSLLLIYETYASRPREGSASGQRDGYAAYSYAKELGVPDGTAIYFAVDYDAPKSDYPAIEAYLYAAKAACAPYRCGVYGKADLVNSVKADCYMQCVAWSNGLVSNKANIYQYEWSGGAEAQRVGKMIGTSVDMNRCGDAASAGLWVPAVPDTVPWYKRYMDWAKEEGIMNDGRPNDPVTRAEAATLLYRFYDKFIKK
jgi:hypothetical protein